VIYGWNHNTRVSLLLVKLIKLFQEIQLGTRGSFDVVEALEPSLETKILKEMSNFPGKPIQIIAPLYLS